MKAYAGLDSPPNPALAMASKIGAGNVGFAGAARGQEIGLARMVLGHWPQEAAQHGGPHFNAVQVLLQPRHRCDQIAHDQVFGRGD